MNNHHIQIAELALEFYYFSHVSYMIDYQLKFDQHISNLCRKASQQLNVLKRFGSYLTKLNKLTMNLCIFKQFQRRMNNHHTQIAELALEFFQVFWSFFQYKNAMPKGISVE
jgi:hypothetical protein